MLLQQFQVALHHVFRFGSIENCFSMKDPAVWNAQKPMHPGALEDNHQIKLFFPQVPQQPQPTAEPFVPTLPVERDDSVQIGVFFHHSFGRRGGQQRDLCSRESFPQRMQQNAVVADVADIGVPDD